MTLDLKTTIHNERTKLLANWLNGLAIALAALGVFAPVFSVVYGDREISAFLVAGTVVCFVCSYILHLWAQRALKGLKQ